MKFSIKYIVIAIGLIGLFSSCYDDLDTVPIDEDVITADVVFEDPAAYRPVLAKLYAGLAVTGQEGPAGQADISGIDEGFGQYLRMYWYMQELTTDEAVIGWNDATIQDLHGHAWTSSDVFIGAMYYRIFYQVSQCNQFLRETTEEKLNARNVDANLQAEIATYRAEARFLRALAYSHAIDLFGNVPFVTEGDPVGAFLPEQISRADLFTYVENEILDFVNAMAEPGQNEYGRADQGAAWMLLSKLYLNAEVYTGTARWNDCAKYTALVIDSGYNLDPDFENLFLADNQKSSGIIFPIVFDGVSTRTWGGTTFVIHAAVGGEMVPADFGIDSGWGGTRTTSSTVNIFDATDGRGMFYTQGQNLEIEDISLFTDGYAVTKFKNLNSDGSGASDLTFPDTDFPLFRLADAYLMYAEAIINGATEGDLPTATGYINQLRERAFGDASGNITQADLTPDFILNERSRELMWECHRRSDLIRYGKFTGSDYLWPWKGNVANGQSTSSHLVLFPIPSADLAANPTLEQNNGY